MVARNGTTPFVRGYIQALLDPNGKLYFYGSLEVTLMHISPALISIWDELNADPVVRWAVRLIALIVVWTIVAILVRYLTRWIQNLDKRTERFDIATRDLKTIDRLSDYIIISGGAIASLAIMGWTNLLVSALTAAGVFAIIIGIAVKDVAANFISGVFILIDQPFAPGDFIEVGGFSGTVEDISLRTTTLLTLDGPMVYIPNSVVAVKPTTNFTLAQDRRISFTVSIANNADVGQAMNTIKRVLEEQQGLLAQRTQLVLVSDLREYALDISVSCYAPKETFFELESDLKQQVLAALHEGQIELAVPVTRNLYPEPRAVRMEARQKNQ
jgi:small conductance mechanosensitive channel